MINLKTLSYIQVKCLLIIELMKYIDCIFQDVYPMPMKIRELYVRFKSIRVQQIALETTHLFVILPPVKYLFILCSCVPHINYLLH